MHRGFLTFALVLCMASTACAAGGVLGRFMKNKMNMNNQDMVGTPAAGPGAGGQEQTLINQPRGILNRKRTAVSNVVTNCKAGKGGVAGEAGPAGPEGPQGITGPVGLQGPPGEMGETGPAGSRGLPGVRGERGDAGEPGPAARVDEDVVKRIIKVEQALYGMGFGTGGSFYMG